MLLRGCLRPGEGLTEGTASVLPSHAVRPGWLNFSLVSVNIFKF